MRINKSLASIAGICLFISLLLTSIDLVCFNRAFFRWQYLLNHTAEEIHISNEGLMNATNTLLDYLQDKRDDIVVVEEVNGKPREIFDARETLHMVDVKNLYLNAMFFRNTMFVAAVVILLAITLRTRSQVYSLLRVAFRNGLLCLAAILSFVGIYAIVDFNSFWMNFHYVFFDNDLFLLDPNISIMINMFPSNFFFAIVMAIIISFACMVIGLRILLSLYRNRLEKRAL